MNQKLTTKKLTRRPSQPMIDEEVVRLTGLIEPKPRIPQFNAFGDDHWKAVRAQLKVLHERMSVDEVYFRFGVTHDVETGDATGNTDYLHDAAMEARRWMVGETPNAPYEGWQTLVGTKQVRILPPPRKNYKGNYVFNNKTNFGYDPSIAKLDL